VEDGRHDHRDRPADADHRPRRVQPPGAGANAATAGPGGATLFFRAYDPLHRRELWSLSANPPAAPGQGAATAASAGTARITWQDGSNNETGFWIDRIVAGTPAGGSALTSAASSASPSAAPAGSVERTFFVPADTTAFSDAGLSPGTAYQYRVRSYNAAGASACAAVAGAVVPVQGVTAGPGAAFTLSGPSGSPVLSVTGGTVTVDGDLSSAYPGIRIEAGGGAAVVFAASQHLSGLTLAGGASATLSSIGAGRGPTNHRVLVVGSLNIDATSGGKLDLSDNDLVLRGGGAAGLANVQALISAGYSKHNWNGSGIISSAAAGKTNNALAYLLNDGAVVKAKTTFGPNNEPVGNTDVLVKYTH
jgi:hypothetical protein